jgi:hypothetical protein
MWSERNNKVRKERRHRTRNATEIKYKRTLKGFIVRKYIDIKKKVTTCKHARSHAYYGLKLCSREEFYAWALNSAEYKRLFKQWVVNCFDRKFTPCPSRINKSKGFVISNMEWMTHSEMSCSQKPWRERKMKKVIL